jgi:tetratricopeptide (TPR) repeat protein
MALMILPDYSDSPGDSLYALARVAADRAVALAPELAEAYAARGFLGSYVGRWNDGTRDLERAVQIDPQYGMAYKFLGQMHVYSGNLSEAEAPLKRATELDPMLPIVWHNLGEYYFSARNDAWSSMSRSRMRRSTSRECLQHPGSRWTVSKRCRGSPRIPSPAGNWVFARSRWLRLAALRKRTRSRRA